MNSPLNANNYLSEFSELAVFNAASTTRSFSTFFGDESFASGGRLAMIRRPSTNNQAQIVTDLNVSPAISTQNMTFNQFNSVHARFLIPRNFISINSSSETSSLGSGTVINAGANDDNVGFAARNKNIGGQVFATMTAAFGAFWSNATSASQMQSVKTLYKQTLGAGLSLP
jgi:hypothetical protein